MNGIALCFRRHSENVIRLTLPASSNRGDDATICVAQVEVMFSSHQRDTDGDVA